MKNLWSSTPRSARIGLVAGALLIVVLTVAIARWSLVKDYQALFTGLNEQDAAAMVAELDRMKQPYELAADGSKILVPREAVHKTRLHLVSKNLPAHGGVGFEIFNNNDYGMTEFTQKVNYQRALQGELTRTILALDEVQSARVHLVLPEAGLFKRAENRAKASVTLALKAGRALEKEQILGIQRLVAASVPDIDTKNVTVLNSAGVALSASPATQTADSGDWKLETKRHIEEYLAKKLSGLVSRAVGADRAAVSVDVLLDYDNVKTTAEEVIAAPGEAGERPSGVLVRERQSTRSSSSGKPATGEGGAGKESDVTNLDSEYQTGRRVQQIISTPGSVKRITVGVVLPPGVDAAQVEKLRELVSVAAGLDKSRGDGVAIHAISIANPEQPREEAMPSAAGTTNRGMTPQLADPKRMDSPTVILALLLAAAALLAIGHQVWRLRKRTPPAPAPLLLDETQRQQLLIDLRGWLAEPSGTSRA
jgi:flagellar M-ring protein FliF